MTLVWHALAATSRAWDETRVAVTLVRAHHVGAGAISTHVCLQVTLVHVCKANTFIYWQTWIESTFCVSIITVHVDCKWTIGWLKIRTVQLLVYANVSWLPYCGWYMLYTIVSIYYYRVTSIYFSIKSVYTAVLCLYILLYYVCIYCCIMSVYKAVLCLYILLYHVCIYCCIMYVYSTVLCLYILLCYACICYCVIAGTYIYYCITAGIYYSTMVSFSSACFVFF